MTTTLTEVVARAMADAHEQHPICGSPNTNLPWRVYKPKAQPDEIDVLMFSGGATDCDQFVRNLAATAAINAIQSSGKWKIVPVEPTAEMYAARREAVGVHANWTAMLSASPKVE